MEVSRTELLCLLACIFSLIPNGKGIINPNLENKLTILTKSEKSPENVFQKDFETTIKFNSHMSSESGKESTRSLDKSSEATDIDPNTKSSCEHIIAAYAPEFKPVKKTSSTYMYLVKLFSHNQKNDNQNLQSSWVFSGGPGMPQIIAVECPGTSIPRNAQLVELNPPILDQALRQQHVTPLETHPSGISKNREEANVPDMYHHKNMGSDQSKDVYTVSQEMAKPTYEPRILESSSKTSDQSNETPISHGYSSPPFPTNWGLGNQRHELDSKLIDQELKIQEVPIKTDHQDQRKDNVKVKDSGDISMTDADSLAKHKSWKQVLECPMPPDKNRDKKLLDLENLSVSKSKEIHQQERTHQNIGSKIHKQKNKDQLSSSGDEWITPKKPFKSTERTKVEFYPSFMEVGRPDLDSSKTSQSPIEVIQGPKDTIRPLQHKKKSKSKGKQKVRAVSADEDNWDLETPEAKPANPTGLNDPEHEDFIKYVQEKLQNYFVSVNDSEGARISLNSLEKPSVRMILEQFLDIDDPTPLLKLELEPRAFEILYGCEKMHPDIYKSDYWNFEIDHILKPLDSVHDEEWMRRKGAFFSQYFKTRESRKFEEHGKSLDVNLREIAKLVNVGSPFETFVEETEDHINALMDLVNSMDQSEFEKLGETFSIDFFYPRFFMVDLRLLELNNLRSDSFFGKEFLQNAMKQGLKIYSIRLLEIALELSSPVVTWKELSQDVIQTKYIQVLSVLADAPCLRPGISKVSLSEAELHSRNGRWIGSLTQKVLMNDPQLWDYVLKRIKLLLSTLKGRGARTLREMAGEKYTHSAYENELIFYDEAFAASFVGLSLFDVARLKNYQRGLRNSPSSKGRNHKNRVYWPKLSSKAVPQFEAFKKYYQLLGQILLLEK